MNTIIRRIASALILCFAVQSLFAVPTNIDEPEQIIVGTGTSSTNGDYLPTNLFYNFSYSQQIYLASEIQNFIITDIAFQYFFSTSYTRAIDIYLGTTQKTAFSNNNDYVPYDNLTLLFSGNVTFTNAGEDNWVNIHLTEPYILLDDANLVVAVHDHTGSWSTSSNKFYTHSVPETRAIAISRDNPPIDLTSLPSANTRPSSITNTKFSGYELTVDLRAEPSSVVIGNCPSNCWVEPGNLTIKNYGFPVTVNSVDISGSFFTISGDATPYDMIYGDEKHYTITPGTDTGSYNENVTVTYNNDATVVIPVSATSYTPSMPDVWELAQTISGFPFSQQFSTSSLHNDYRLPGDNADGADAVLKMVLTEDFILNATVTADENPKLAIYREGFEGQGGPRATNAFEGVGQQHLHPCN